MNVLTTAALVALLAAWPAAAPAVPEAAPPTPPAGQAGKPASPRGAKPSPQAAKPPVPPAKPGSRDPGRPGSFEVSVLAAYGAPTALGTKDATLTPNQGASGSRYTLFKTTGELGSSLGVAATAVYHLTRVFSVEGEFDYTAPSVKVAVSDDAENAAGVSFDGETLAQYTVGAALVVNLKPLSFARGRGRTFVSAGGGYRREVHDQNFTIDTGAVYHAGGGVKYFFASRPRGAVRAFGIRAEGRLLLGDGFSFDDRTTRTFSVRGGVIVAF